MKYVVRILIYIMVRYLYPCIYKTVYKYMLKYMIIYIKSEYVNAYQGLGFVEVLVTIFNVSELAIC